MKKALIILIRQNAAFREVQKTNAAFSSHIYFVRQCLQHTLTPWFINFRFYSNQPDTITVQLRKLLGNGFDGSYVDGMASTTSLAGSLFQTGEHPGPVCTFRYKIETRGNDTNNSYPKCALLTKVLAYPILLDRNYWYQLRKPCFMACIVE